MLFLEDIENYKRHAEISARENTLAYLRRYELSRDKVEEMVARLCPRPSDVYYVSTVPAGLAGSTSDLDIILVPQESGDFGDVSSMLFCGDRRVGAKIIPASVVSDALEALQGLVPRALLDYGGNGDSLEAFVPIKPVKWEDLERLVNGFSFTRGANYLPALNDIAVFAVAKASANYRQQRLGARLAARSGADAATFGYLVGAVQSAMDALMASCGRVQAKAKWTLERWSRFTTTTDSPADESRQVLEAAREKLQTLRRQVPEPVTFLSSIDRIFERMGAVPAGKSNGLHLPPQTRWHPFLPGAVCIKTAGRTVVVPSRVVERLDTIDADQEDFTAWPAKDAALLLWLVQLELIVAADRGAGK